MVLQSVTDVFVTSEKGSILFQGATTRAVDALRASGHTLYEGTTVLLSESCEIEALYEALEQRELRTFTLS